MTMSSPFPAPLNRAVHRPAPSDGPAGALEKTARETEARAEAIAAHDRLVENGRIGMALFPHA
jgi:hypothetical protein